MLLEQDSVHGQTLLFSVTSLSHHPPTAAAFHGNNNSQITLMAVIKKEIPEQ
jgi:hypothetical protein